LPGYTNILLDPYWGYNNHMIGVAFVWILFFITLIIIYGKL